MSCPDRWENYQRQAISAERWGIASLTLARVAGAWMVHDEISFDDEEASERFYAAIMSCSTRELITLAQHVAVGYREPGYEAWNGLFWDLGMQNMLMWEEQ